MKACTTALTAAPLAIVFSSGGPGRGHGRQGGSEGLDQGQNPVLHRMPWPVGPGLSCLLPHTAAARQQVQYLQNQFTALAGHNRDNPVAKRFMVPVAESSPAMRTAIAEYFSALKAPPAGGGPKTLMAQGKQIFEEGLPNENVPACAACHGSNGEGSDLVPRLAGQMYAYTVEQLNGWGKGYRGKDPVSPENPNTMQAIATSMTKEQITAVAAYLSRLNL